jgi:Zn-dependent peptidase ImmA (M78 family)
MERQAPRFAAELLMPEPVCRHLFGCCKKEYGDVPRVIAYRMAGELLVSRRAIGWRLHGMGLIEKPAWLKVEGAASTSGGPSAEAD